MRAKIAFIGGRIVETPPSFANRTAAMQHGFYGVVVFREGVNRVHLLSSLLQRCAKSTNHSAIAIGVCSLSALLTSSRLLFIEALPTSPIT